MRFTNTCEYCLKAQHPTRKISNLLFDTGVCSSCGECHEVVDLELLDWYAARGLGEEVIWRHLPRLRLPRPDKGKAMLDWAEIERRVNKMRGSPRPSGR